MLRRVIVSVLCLCFCAVVAVPVSADTAGNRDLFDDTADGANDMSGPRVGYLYYKQRANGSIQMSIILKNADANTTYQVFASCTPAHFGPRIFLPDTVSTDAEGRGKNTSIVISAADLAACGSGDIQGHVDLSPASNPNDLITAADFDYTGTA
jgi:hypothetical protein